MSADAAVEVAAFFDDRAAVYDRDYEMPGWGGYVLRTRLQAVLEVIGDGPGTVLDSGMGPGRLCEHLAARGWNVSGVDISEAMVHSARERLPAAASRLLQGTLEELPFTSASFDAVTATGVLEYAASVPAAVRELARVLRPGGRAVLSIPNRRSLHGVSRRLSDPVGRAVSRALSGACTQPGRRDRIPSPDMFRRLVGDAGLDIDCMRFVGALAVPAPADRLLPGAVERLSAVLESRSRMRTVLATQIVVGATKPEGG